MSITKILILLFVIGLSGCSSNPNYHEAGCGSADPICLALSIAKTVDGHEPPQKCSEMTGEKRKQCTEQVDSLKKHIYDASNK
ncbi:MAG TPA: hypothetical protein DEO86_10215 [Colwellia sp.]|nr:hypothetical protein [Colwellia sp.]|tara:strand:+ start:2335 stop:2583 length:249 start_codon:yes stop_codon:yes gene_type:complete